MKILAIRGHNLASLGGSFELDLGVSPFDRAGLFAITGPVGAGKSTLLDAVCLALYDRTPRLTGRGGAPVGSEQEEEPQRLGSNDVRTVLRRGAVEGHAEVDFRGCDGGCYRARWSVRRARRKIDGRLQQQQLALTDIESGQVLQGDRKQDALGAIQDKLGLSFDQFRRSVLLAQGDFAAFLKSDSKDRAELLERMTGTEIYRRISQRAYERHQEEAAQLSILQETVQIQKPAEPEERARLEQDCELATKELERLALDKAAASQACEWYAALERLTKLSDEARAAAAGTRAVWEASKSLRQQLGVVQAAQPLRPMLESLELAKKELVVAAEGHTKRAVELNDAQKKEMELAAISEKADAGLREAEGRRKDLAPALKTANELDIVVAEASRVVQQGERQEREASAAVAEVTRTLNQLGSELEGLRAREEELRSWLSENGGLAALAGNWEQWKLDLGRYGNSLVESKRLTEQGSVISTELAEIQSRLRHAESEVAGWRGKLSGAKADMELASKRARRVSITELRQKREKTTERRESLGSMMRLIQQARELQGQRAEFRTRIADARSRSAAAAEAAEEHCRAVETLAAALHEARRALSAAETARSLQDHRRALVEGEPCPLCGAKHHPLAHEPFEDLLADQRTRVAELAEEHQARSKAETSCRAGQASWEERAVALERDEAGLATRLRNLLKSPELPADPLAEGVGESIERQISDVDKQLAELELEQERAEAALQSAQQAAAELQKVSDSHQAAVDAVESASLRERAAVNGAHELERELRSLGSIQEEILSRLAPALEPRDGWRDELRNHPGRFADSCAEQVALFVGRSEELAGLSKRSEEMTRQLAERKVLLQERTRSREKLADQLAGQRRELDAARGRRAALLSGRPTVEVEGELAESVRKAAKLREEGAAHWKRAQVKHAEAMVRFQHASRSREELRSAVEDAQGRLACAAESAEIPLGEVAGRLERDPAWIRARERELAARKKDLERTDTILAERESRRLQHESTGRPRLSAEKAREALKRTQAEMAELNARLARLRMELAKDDDARDRLAELGPRMKAQTQVVETWQALTQLIGSARGDRFQVFAQSLTLDTLLARANHHLGELSRRYRLVRVPGTDLDLQVVDQEMGDALRSIHSLSGGESFLVSLALALGLSSLSARRTPIETLFIDEGFGSLDPISLETALSALDTLQACGRQVGIVSHVDGLAERIGVGVEVVPEGGGRSRLLRSGGT